MRLQRWLQMKCLDPWDFHDHEDSLWTRHSFFVLICVVLLFRCAVKQYHHHYQMNKSTGVYDCQCERDEFWLTELPEKVSCVSGEKPLNPRRSLATAAVVGIAFRNPPSRHTR